MTIEKREPPRFVVRLTLEYEGVGDAVPAPRVGSTTIFGPPPFTREATVVNVEVKEVK